MYEYLSHHPDFAVAAHLPFDGGYMVKEPSFFSDNMRYEGRAATKRFHRKDADLIR